jgi:hypothetical protein
MGEKIIEDSQRGRREKLMQGKIVAPTPKYGYVYIPKREKDGGRFDIAPDQARVVKQVFDWYAHDGLSMYAIAQRLNEAGIVSAGHNGKPGGLWSRTTVWQMLKSATYLGEHCCSGVTVPIPPIISTAPPSRLFNASSRRTASGWWGGPRINTCCVAICGARNAGGDA